MFVLSYICLRLIEIALHVCMCPSDHLSLVITSSVLCDMATIVGARFFVVCSLVLEFVFQV